MHPGHYNKQIDIEWQVLKGDIEYRASYTDSGSGSGSGSIEIAEDAINNVRDGVLGFTIKKCKKNVEYTITIDAYSKKDGKHIGRGSVIGIMMDELLPPRNIYCEQAGDGVVSVHMRSQQASIERVKRIRMIWKELLFEGEEFALDDGKEMIYDTEAEGVFELSGLNGLRIIGIYAKVEGERVASGWSKMYSTTILPDMSEMGATAGPDTGDVTIRWRSVFPRGSNLGDDVGYSMKVYGGIAGTGTPLLEKFIGWDDCGEDGVHEYVLNGLEVNRPVKISIQVMYNRYARTGEIVEIVPREMPGVVEGVTIRRCGGADAGETGDIYEIKWVSPFDVDVCVGSGEATDATDATDAISCFSGCTTLSVKLKSGVDHTITLTANTGLRGPPAVIKYRGGTPCVLENVRLDGSRLIWDYTDGDHIYVHVKDNAKIIPSVKSTTMTFSVDASQRYVDLPADVVLSRSTIRVMPVNEYGPGEHACTEISGGRML